MAKKRAGLKDLQRLAVDYGVADNPIVQELTAKYLAQRKILDEIAEGLETDGLITKKEYVKGRENLCAHPLLDAWPKNNDSARNTLDALGDAIVKFGHQPEKKDSKLRALLEDND